jgi:hypothetical protein
MCNELARQAGPPLQRSCLRDVKDWIAVLHDTRRLPNSGDRSLTNAMRFKVDFLFSFQSFLSEKT